MSDKTLAAPSQKQSNKLTMKRVLAPQNVRTAADILQVGLSLLEGSRKTRPYAHALRVATSIGAAAVPVQQEKIVERLRETRAAMKALEAQGPLTKEQKQQVKHHLEQVFVLVDLFLEAQ